MNLGLFDVFLHKT